VATHRYLGISRADPKRLPLATQRHLNGSGGFGAGRVVSGTPRVGTFMGFCRLVPSEYSSGAHTARGA
jgi:hypothetical protein